MEIQQEEAGKTLIQSNGLIDIRSKPRNSQCRYSNGAPDEDLNNDPMRNKTNERKTKMLF